MKKLKQTVLSDEGYQALFQPWEKRKLFLDAWNKAEDEKRKRYEVKFYCFVEKDGVFKLVDDVIRTRGFDDKDEALNFASWVSFMYVHAPSRFIVFVNEFIGIFCNDVDYQCIANAISFSDEEIERVEPAYKYLFD